MIPNQDAPGEAIECAVLLVFDHEIRCGSVDNRLGFRTQQPRGTEGPLRSWSEPPSVDWDHGSLDLGRIVLM